jgi:uncharacterized membrane protein
MTSSMHASLPQTAARWILGGALFFAGVTHLTVARVEFLAQVPRWLPLPGDFVVLASGVVELALGAALLLVRTNRERLGWVVAAFFVAIFPGNINQYVHGIDAFGLHTDTQRLVRLFFQPLLVIWALWCTGALRAWRARRLQATR